MGTVVEFLNPLFVVLGGLTMPVKIAWSVWLLWALGQLAWTLWQRNRSQVYRPSARQSGVRPTAVRPPSKKIVTPASASSPYGTSDFIAALDEEQATASIEMPEHTSAYR
jgi:hypothetical protein